MPSGQHARAVADRALDLEAARRKFARESPLEGSGFELPVPRHNEGRPADRLARRSLALRNHGRHIWDRRDAEGRIGAMATVVVPWFADRYAEGMDWRAMAWWIHDNLSYSQLQFFLRLAAFNIGWHERPRRRIDSYITPRGCLTRPGMDNNLGEHRELYRGFPLCVARTRHPYDCLLRA